MIKITLIPKIKSDRWAGCLNIAFILLMALKSISFIPLPSFFIAAIGIAGFVVGIVAIVKKEISAANFLSTLIGVVILAWIIGEMIYPH